MPEQSSINKQLIIELMSKLYIAKRSYPYMALAFMMKPDDLINFFDVFGGTTMEIPTKEEFTKIVQVCLVDAIGDFDKAKIINKELLNGLSKKQYLKIHEEINK